MMCSACLSLKSEHNLPRQDWNDATKKNSILTPCLQKIPFWLIGFVSPICTVEWWLLAGLWKGICGAVGYHTQVGKRYASFYTCMEQTGMRVSLCALCQNETLICCKLENRALWREKSMHISIPSLIIWYVLPFLFYNFENQHQWTLLKIRNSHLFTNNSVVEELLEDIWTALTCKCCILPKKWPRTKNSIYHVTHHVIPKSLERFLPKVLLA